MTLLTTEEKIKHFTAVTIENMQSQCDESLEEQKKKMDDYFEEHKKEALKNAKLEEQIEIDGIKRKASKEFTTEQLHIRRKYNHKQEELQDKLFVEVRELFKEYFKTEEYKNLLIKLIKRAINVARGEEVTIFIDAMDIDLKDDLEKATGVKLACDGRIFFGGIIAEIPSKNILIDSSFESKLDTAKENYTITF